MIQILLDGGEMLLVYWKTVLVFFCTVFGFGGWGLSFFRASIRENKCLLFSLKLGLGTLLLTTLTFALFLLSLLWREVLTIGAFFIFFVGLILLVTDLLRYGDWSQMGLGVMVLLLYLLLRMAWVNPLVLPPYSDSPTHALVVINLLDPSARPDVYYSFQTIFQHYYHYAVHCLTAWLALLTGQDSLLLLAVVGQIFVTILPFFVFTLVAVLTEDNFSAWAAAAIAALAWFMPAFAVNWGKFPALAGLAVLPIPLVFMLLDCHLKSTPRRGSFLLLMAVLTLAVILLHSRASLVIGLAVAAYLVSGWLLTGFKFRPFFLAGMVFILVAGLIFWGWLRPDLIGIYTSNWFVFIVLAILLPLAMRSFPLPTLAALWMLAGMALLSNLRVPDFLKKYAFELMDRQYIQMSLYLPFSILTGLGLAGLRAWLVSKKWIPELSLLLLVGLSLLQAPPLRSFYPDPCCNYATQDDLLAFEWLKKQGSPQTLVLIAGFPTTNRILEMDSGAWVYPASGLNVKAISLNKDFNDLVFIQEICRGWDDVYIYSSGSNLGFSRSTILANDQVYSLAFSSGATGIIRINSCNP